jgi:hypothetical protein
MMQEIIGVAINKAKLTALYEVYHELLLDHTVPYEACQKIKNKIDLLEKID